MNQIFYFPLIDGDGYISEVMLPKREGFFIRTRAHRSILFSYTHEHFQLKTFAYKLDTKRMVEIEVYVSDLLFNDLPAGAKYSAVEKLIKEKAPWFFSYGKRKELQ